MLNLPLLIGIRVADIEDVDVKPRKPILYFLDFSSNSLYPPSVSLSQGSQT